MNVSRILALLLALLMWSGFSAAVCAADRDVPLSVWSLRDRLLRDRTLLLNNRADLNSRIMQLRTVLAEADKLLMTSSLSPEHYLEISRTKTRLTQNIFEIQRRLDNTERLLLDNNKDLANVEYTIQRYACLK